MQERDGSEDNNDDYTEAAAAAAVPNGSTTPDIIYAQIVPVLPGGVGHDVDTSPNAQNENGSVIYSELQDFSQNGPSSHVYENVER